MKKAAIPHLSEAQEQTMIFGWARWKPELKWLFAIPNGGNRNVIEAVNLKRQGVKKGVSDMCLALPKGKYHGLFIELKVGKNKPTKEQKEFIAYANSYDYLAKVCYGHEEAISLIEKYLNLKSGQELSLNEQK